MGYIAAQASQNAAMGRINTGLRIQDAKDDAAGSTILTTMKTQFAGNVVAMRNTNDGVNLLKTATEGIKAIEGKVGRLRELAVQSPNAPYTGAARDASGHRHAAKHSVHPSANRDTAVICRANMALRI